MTGGLNVLSGYGSESEDSDNQSQDKVDEQLSKRNGNQSKNDSENLNKRKEEPKSMASLLIFYL